MSDNALAKSRDFLRSKTFPNLNFEQNLIADLADALERAERERNDQEAMSAAANVVMDHMEKVIAFQQSRAESAERDLRVAAANEAAMREAAELAVRPMGLPPITIMGGDTVVLDTANLNKLRAALSIPASALAQRYEALVRASPRFLAEFDEAMEFADLYPDEAAEAREEFVKALAALNHQRKSNETDSAN